MTSTSESTENSRTASAVGLATVVDSGERAGTVLDVFYPAPALRANPDTTYEADPVNDLTCLLYTSPSPRDATLSRMPSSA